MALALAFYKRHAGEWITYNKSEARSIAALARRGLIEVNEYGQARA
jgi:hypothetical protein